MNNFNTNEFKSNINNLNNEKKVIIDKNKINLIHNSNNEHFQKLLNRTNIKKKSNKKNNYKNKINKQKRVVVDENIEFPHGSKYKCIGPCYPANTLYYHPLTLQAIKSKNDSCPTELHKNNGKVKIKDKCTLNKNYDYESYDMFADIIQVATTDDLFLRQIYNIKNIYDVELFLENEIKQLANYSQKRIINSIYKVYRDDDSFPSKNFVDIVKKIIKKNYDIKIKSKEIITEIMNNKYNKNNNNLFNILLK
jgi:hypothetical protein